MTGTKLVIIRVAVLLIMTGAVFFVGWYLFDRYVQLNTDQSSYQTEELNNPRLNESLLKSVKSNFETRRIYSKGETVNYDVKDKDPFYH
ncbi:MAG: hypothetical protein PHS44_01360 [Candidatus Dojkabacteria bacterium]|jgi:hypothetical protein|nr:hypothetical protein [Candidatus Dojkabacteria bacterium]